MSIQLTIVTPQGEAFAERVDTVVLPGSEGDFGVLEGHERFLAPLRIGPVSIQSGGTTRWAAASRGFADVAGEDVVVLVDQCQLREDIDASEVESSRADAEAALRELPVAPESGSEGAMRRDELEGEIERADVWLEVARKA
jgi:F-type H+-transporting ATPase subunit epsilon